MAPVALCLLILALASAERGANPIRKVVTLLQDMQKEVAAEGAKEKELFDKFMCFCTGNTAELEKSIDDAKAKIEELNGKLKSETAEKAQLELDVVQHKTDKESAEADLSKAEAIRSKEQAEFEADSGEAKKNIEAMGNAIPALEKGMGAASLLQAPGGLADRIKRLVQSSSAATDFDRQQVTAFLEQKEGQDYAPQSGQIVGILKAMKDEMEGDLKKMLADEETAVKGFGDLKASKEAEIATAGEAVRAKTARSGTLAVSVVQTQADIGDTEDELADGQKFLASLMKACPEQEKIFGEHEKTRAEEVSAIGQAIDVLNDDDALDVFKKAVPAAFLQEAEQGVRRYGFLQQRDSENSRARSMAKVQALLAGVEQSRVHSKRMDIMLYMIRSKLKLLARSKQAPDFGNITGMVDGMIVLEEEEQQGDDKQKPWCNGEFEQEDREEKSEKGEIASLDAEMLEEADAIAGLEEEIKALQEEIAGLDKTVAQATEQRKEEHAEYQETLSLTKTAIELIGKAKNKLQKFYNPALYKAPPKEELSAEDQIIANVASFAEISAHRTRVAQPEMPEGLGGYEKKTQKSGGVMALMDMITKDLDASLSDIEHEEGTSQKEYVELMADSQASRAQNLKSITDKEGAKAELNAKKVAAKEKEMGDLKDLENIHGYVTELHGSCDFILENFDIRKEARTAEIESLKSAKAILAGAVM